MQHPFFKRQQGFTLLELLVVITLLAVLAVGALVAYDGVGDKAEAAATADAVVKTDSALRQFKAVTNVYPNQWDNLVAVDGSLIDALPSKLTAVVGVFTTGAAASDVTKSMGQAGITEIQYWTANTKSSNGTVVPNLAHNENINSANAQEQEHWEDGAVGPDGNIALISGVKAASDCLATGAAQPSTGTNLAGDGNTVQNKYNDFLELDECHVVVALGFGSDAAASTTGSSVTIGKAPSFSKTDKTNPANNINPNEQYSRYVGLFLVGSDKDKDGNVESNEYLDKARLIALIAPDGSLVDENLAAANKN